MYVLSAHEVYTILRCNVKPKLRLMYTNETPRSFDIV